MPAEPAADQPRHPLPALTTYELRDYRRALEAALACPGPQDPGSPARAGLQARLAAVIAEQESRAKLAAGGRT